MTLVTSFPILLTFLLYLSLTKTRDAFAYRPYREQALLHCPWTLGRGVSVQLKCNPHRPSWRAPTMSMRWLRPSSITSHNRQCVLPVIFAPSPAQKLQPPTLEPTRLLNLPTFGWQCSFHLRWLSSVHRGIIKHSECYANMKPCAVTGDLDDGPVFTPEITSEKSHLIPPNGAPSFPLRHEDTHKPNIASRSAQ